MQNDFPLLSLPFTRGAARLMMSMLALLTLPLASRAQVLLTGASPTYTQNFDALPASNISTFADNSTIAGLYAQRTGTGSTVVANDGTFNAGTLYSYGTSAATERALGTLGSGGAMAGNFAYGIQFLNNTASPITSVTLSYTGEQWRNSAAAAQSVAFSYAISATAITALTPNAAIPLGFIPAIALDFTSPVTGGTAGALNGNAAPNRTSLSGTFTVTVPAGSYLMLRWYDPDHPGNDHGLAIDDVNASFANTATPGPILTAVGVLTAFNALAGQPSAAQTYTLTGVNLTGSVSIAAPTGYEVSAAYADASTSGGYFSSLTGITPAQVAGPGATISVRLVAGAPIDPSSTPSGSVANTGGGTSGSQGVPVAGTVVGEPGLTPAPTVSGSALTATTATLTLGAGAGTRLLVVVRPAASTATVPTDATVYLASPVYGAGTALGAGFVVFAAPNATAAAVAGLLPSSSYVADVYSYNVGTAIGFENYQPTGSTSGPFTTPAPAPTTAGTLLLEDDFDYPAGTVLADNNTTPSTTTGWRSHANEGTNNIPTAAGNSTQPQYPQGPGVPAGASTRASLQINGQDISKGFAPPPVLDNLYAAAVVNVSAAQANGDYFLHFYDNTSGGGVLRGRLFVKSTAGGINFGVSVSQATAAAVYSPTVFALNTNYLVVLKYQTNGTATVTSDDVASLFVLSNTATPATEPGATATAGPEAGAGAAPTGLNAIALRQGSATGAAAAATLTVDGLRVASGWGTAVGRPVYTVAGATVNAGNYYDLTLNNADVLTPAGAVNVEGALVLTSGLVNTSVANSLTLYPAATVSGGSATSFVNGPLIRRTNSGAATTVFPIGKGAAYRPLTLTAAAQTAATTYTAEQFEGNPGQNFNPTDNGLGTAPVQRVSFRRSYAVSSSVTTPGNFTGTLTLSFEPDDFVNVPGSPDLVVAKRDGGAPNNWLNLGRSAYTGGPGVVGGSYLSGTLASQPFSNFSDFALGAQNPGGPVNPFGGASNPLPVTLIRFGAQRRTDQTVSVSWATASERQSATFEVQRSPNGREFGVVATVAARGTSSEPTVYAALDRTAPTGPLYYRLRQVDTDGTATFSPVVAVMGSLNPNPTAKTIFYPNPTRHTLGFLAETPTPYRVLNQLGQVLLRGTAQAGPATIPVETLAPGLYFLEAQTSAGRSVQKFEKQ